MSLEKNLAILNLKLEDIWNTEKTAKEIRAMLDSAVSAKTEEIEQSTGLLQRQKSADLKSLGPARNYLEFTLIDQPPLPKDKLVFIFDFDCTITKNFTYKDEKWSAALDKESVKANIRCFDQFKQFVKKALAQGHRVAIASFNDDHFDNVDPNTGEKTLGGYHLIKHYLQVIFEDEPKIVEKIIIQAYQTNEENKTLHTNNIRNYLKVSKEQTVLADDTSRHVNRELEQDGNAFLVTEHNFAKLLDRYAQALSDSAYIKNPITKYPNIPALEKKLGTVLTAETFIKEYQAFYDLFSVDTKVDHLLKLLGNNNADEKLIGIYFNDREVFSAACTSKIDKPFPILSGTYAKQTFPSLFKTLCEIVSAKNTQMFKSVIEKIRNYNLDWKTIDFNTDIFVGITHTTIRSWDSSEYLNNNVFGSILLPFLPEEQQIALIISMLKHGHYHFLNDVAAYNSTLLDKFDFKDIGSVATSSEVKTEVKDFLIKKYRSTFQLVATTTTEISNYLLFEIKLDNFEKFATLLQQLSDYPDNFSIKAILINRLIDSTLPNNKIAYFNELLKNPPTINLLTGKTTKQQFFIHLIWQLKEVSILQQMLTIYGSDDLDLFELFGTAVHKVEANKSSEIALFILENIIAAENIPMILQITIKILGITHPFLSQVQQIFVERKLNYEEPSLDEKLLVETSRHNSSPENIKILLEQGAKVSLEILEKELINGNLQLFSKLAKYSDPVAVNDMLVSAMRNELNRTFSLSVNAANKLLFCLLFNNCFKSADIYQFMESFLYKQIDNQFFSDIQFLVALGMDMSSSVTTGEVPLEFARDLKAKMLEKMSNELVSDDEEEKSSPEYQDLLEIIEFLELKTKAVEQENQPIDSLAKLAQQIKNNSTPGVIAWFKENPQSSMLSSTTAFPLLYMAVTHGNVLVLRMLLQNASQDFLQTYGFQLLNHAVQSSLTFKEKNLGAVVLSYIFTELTEHGAVACLSEPSNMVSLLEKILNNFTVPKYSSTFVKNSTEILLKKIADTILQYPQVCQVLQNNQQALIYLLTPDGKENLQILLNQMPKFEKEQDSLEAMNVVKEKTMKRKIAPTNLTDFSAKMLGEDLSNVFRNNESYKGKQEEEIQPSKKLKQEDNLQNTSSMDFFSNH